MIKRIMIASAAMLAFGTPLARAGTSTGEFAVEDVGRASCSTFNQAVTARAPSVARYVGFVTGYMTAANRYEPNTFDLTPWHNEAAFSLIMQTHCRKAPKDNMAHVAQKLVEAMRTHRLTEVSRVLQIRDGRAQTTVYQAVLQRAQSALTKKGLYRGAANGQFTPQLKLALQSFQTSARLTPTGLPDAATLWVLLNP